MFGPIAHTWVFLVVAVMASISYGLRKGRFNLFPPTDRWIIAWMGLWWVWIMALISLMENSDLRWSFARIFLCYIVAPLPIFLLFAGDLKRARGFSVAYILTTLVGGYVCLRMADVTNAMLLSDPLLLERPMRFLGLYNYHWFGWAQAITLLLITAFFQENRNIVIRLVLLVGGGACVYFLMMAGSKQSIIGVFLALSVFIWWIPRQRGVTRLSGLLLLGVVSLLAVLIFQQAPELLRAEHSHLNEVVSSGMEERSELWMQGLGIFASSPIWGTGFNDGAISHNLFVSTLADQGIVGMIYFVGFLWFFVRQLHGVWEARGPENLAIWRMAFFCVALFGFFHSQVSGNVISTWEIYWSTAFLWHLGWAFKKSLPAFPPGRFVAQKGIFAGQPMHSRSLHILGWNGKKSQT
jgi:hypothetical protein